MWGMVARFEERVTGSAARQSFWRAAQASVRPEPGQSLAIRLPALANTLALVHFDDDEDVRDLARLSTQLGRTRLAALQDEMLAPIDTAPGRPVTTDLVRVLGERAWGKESRTEGSLTHDLADLRDLCSEVALRLLMVDDGDDSPAPRMESAQSIVDVFHDGDIGLWRRLVTAAVADPWAGRTEEYTALLDPERHPREHAGMSALAELARRIAEEDERRAVADHIRGTIASTGLTQREFATLVGTSPSRLSTYVTGSVTPSAAMLLRINRMAKRARSGSAGSADERA